ncbi:hypothetical protein ATANTOWER_025137 [Ataeniobius toweri]|uniref:Uncharacterized protein n=1 Tax=Ataeniobius toweri TaxID=208326 RepID=A0ABU7BEV2_9TELE|nr:hypothetical protein [Ataeniobius toweri]
MFSRSTQRWVAGELVPIQLSLAGGFTLDKSPVTTGQHRDTQRKKEDLENQCMHGDKIKQLHAEKHQARIQIHNFTAARQQ